ncbi:yrdC domain-containing protein, mitochondrial-like [Schistocerca americana]|uniref:yrdC domain-containing protein, mitochondrial-like n=1 Tax=Schistocerca americana TaxID=7009 RepID=UPI001F4F8F1C|nr:yrdC domain-containing protein, mitochondrial-like [Schistocerca americana]
MQDCVIAVPTDTVYGLAGAVQSEDAVEKLYKIKRRDAAKPIAICVSSISKMEKWADTSILPPALLQCILRGPFTIVLKRSKTFNAKFNTGIPNVGIRIPQDRFIVEVVKKFGERIALTSANSSGKQSATEVEEFSHLWQYVDAVFDAGKNPQEIRTGSTVVDLSGHGNFKIIRAGLLCDALRPRDEAAASAASGCRRRIMATAPGRDRGGPPPPPLLGPPGIKSVLGRAGPGRAGPGRRHYFYALAVLMTPPGTTSEGVSRHLAHRRTPAAAGEAKR